MVLDYTVAGVTFSAGVARRWSDSTVHSGGGVINSLSRPTRSGFLRFPRVGKKSREVFIR